MLLLCFYLGNFLQIGTELRSFFILKGIALKPSVKLLNFRLFSKGASLRHPIFDVIKEAKRVHPTCVGTVGYKV